MEQDEKHTFPLIRQFFFKDLFILNKGTCTCELGGGAERERESQADPC